MPLPVFQDCCSGMIFHTEKKIEYNDQIIKNNRILVNMIEDLIDTSKIESGSLQLHPSPVKPEHIL